jgi:hypothetical protein
MQALFSLPPRGKNRLFEFERKWLSPVMKVRSAF